MMTRACLLLAGLLILDGCTALLPETRAMWVVRDALTSPERVTRMVEDAVEAGFNTLLVQVRGRGDAYYKSDLVPRAEALAGQPADFDPLQLVLQQARERGVAVHAWINLLLVSNLSRLPSSSAHVVVRHPEWLVLPAAWIESRGRPQRGDNAALRALSRYFHKTRSADGLFLDPARPEVRDHILQIVRELATGYDLDGVHLDYVRYPGSDPGYGLEAFPAFSKLHPETAGGRAAPAPANALRLAGEHRPEWDQFRRDQVTALVDRIRHEVRLVSPTMLLSAAVVADVDLAYESRLQDWRRWLEMGILDVVCPMAYTAEAQVFEKRIRVARVSSPHSRVWAGIGAYKLKGDGIIQQVGLSRTLGTDGFVVFSYNTLAASEDSRRELLQPLAEFLEPAR